MFWRDSAYTTNAGIQFVAVNSESLMSIGDGEKFEFGFSGSGNLYFYAGDSSSSIETPNPCAGNTWCHLTFVYDDTSELLQVYADGVFYATLANGPFTLQETLPACGHATRLTLHLLHKRLKPMPVYKVQWMSV